MRNALRENSTVTKTCPLQQQPRQVRLLKTSWEMMSDDFMRNSQLLFSRLMKEAPNSIDLFTFAKGSGMYNPNYEVSGAGEGLALG